MKHSALVVCAAALLLGGGVGSYYGVRAALAPASTAEALPAAPSNGGTERSARDGSGADLASVLSALPPAEPLAWSELLEPGAALVPSAKTKALAGQRVRLVGFMAQMELPIPGAFYLVPQPVECDEAGGGTADLMPASVLVLSELAQGQVLPHAPGALEVSGVLEVGNQPGPDGRMSAFRLRLDRGASAASAPAAAESAGNISG
ncbi:MAG TPA: hypothetical protein VMG12_42795 [Polyangiaceae bacterium]|nr:hypothetical protein [Polyangiaceae bacterium]